MIGRILIEISFVLHTINVCIHVFNDCIKKILYLEQISASIFIVALLSLVIGVIFSLRSNTNTIKGVNHER